MEIDLHGMELSEAVIEVFYALEDCKSSEDLFLEIVHGYQSGRVLKNHFSSQKFLKSAEREGYRLSKQRSSNPGTTLYKILSFGS
ncbi:MAG: Smr/MutS family protein [Promethearchaeota archaeon]